MTVDLLSRRNGRFALQRMTSIEWIVVDTSQSPDSGHRTVACIYEVDELEYDVTWLRDLGLPTKYMSPADVPDDIRKATDRWTRIPSRKPIPIPHRAPTAVLAG